MTTSRDFDEQIDEAAVAPIEGWGFAWLDGRASEERPPWSYSTRMAELMRHAKAALDIQTGGGEVLAQISQPPPELFATESWPPNVAIARANLAAFGATVIEVADEEPLPLPDARFDLVVSRHPTLTLWDEIARVLTPSGRYFSQQIGPGSNRELTDFMMGPQKVNEIRDPARAGEAAERVGLIVEDLRSASLRTVFNDIGAVVWFLRKVIWTVPGFSVEAYRARLYDLHRHIERNGPFVAHAERFLIESRRPSTGQFI